jgi:hypothetical protein
MKARTLVAETVEGKPEVLERAVVPQRVRDV